MLMMLVLLLLPLLADNSSSAYDTVGSKLQSRVSVLISPNGVREHSQTA
jgi:hypothetical protein